MTSVTLNIFPGPILSRSHLLNWGLLVIKILIRFMSGKHGAGGSRGLKRWGWGVSVGGGDLGGTQRQDVHKQPGGGGAKGGGVPRTWPPKKRPLHFASLI